MIDYLDFFKRIQGGGTPMTDQELRRAISRGTFTTMLDSRVLARLSSEIKDGGAKYAQA